MELCMELYMEYMELYELKDQWWLLKSSEMKPLLKNSQCRSANTSSSVAARVPTQINESGGTCQVLGTHCGLQLEFAYTLW